MRVFYAQAVYEREEIDAVVDVLENSPLQLMNGPRVSLFEERVGKLFGKKHGLMVTSGSAANLLAITALGLEKGSEVITPALTFSTTVAPLIQCGLVPVFIDVEPDTFVIDTDSILQMITPKTKAMMIPNLIGNLPDWQALRKIADDHGLLLIEDSADTIGYTLNGEDTGRLSDVVTTSFYASHVMTAGGFGGMISANDENIFKRAALLRGWGRSSSLTGESENSSDRFNSEIDGIPYDAKFMFESIGYNFLPSEISAAFGLVQLDRLPEYIARRKTNFAALRSYFAEFEKWFILPRVTNNVDTAWLAVPLIVRDDAPFTRQELQKFLESRDIQTRTVFTGNILRQPGFRDIERREAPGGFPNADQVMRGGLLLGCHQGLGEEEIAYVKAQFNEFAGQQ